MFSVKTLQIEWRIQILTWEIGRIRKKNFSKKKISFFKFNVNYSGWGDTTNEHKKIRCWRFRRHKKWEKRRKMSCWWVESRLRKRRQEDTQKHLCLCVFFLRGSSSESEAFSSSYSSTSDAFPESKKLKTFRGKTPSGDYSRGHRCVILDMTCPFSLTFREDFWSDGSTICCRIPNPTSLLPILNIFSSYFHLSIFLKFLWASDEDFWILRQIWRRLSITLLDF